MEVTDPVQEGGRRERPTLHELLQCEPTANEGREDGVNHSASASLAVLVLLPMIFAMALVPTHKELATLLYIIIPKRGRVFAFQQRSAVKDDWKNERDET